MLRTKTVSSHSTRVNRAWVATAVVVLAAVLLPAAGCSGSKQTSDPPPAAAPSAPSATSSAATSSAAPTVFAAIGDYGVDNMRARAVADLVASWDPAYILALGDCYYTEAGGTGTGRYHQSTGKYYGDWLADVKPAPARRRSLAEQDNAFFPIMGNHDYSDATPSPETYLDYFTLPGKGIANTSGNERYYDFVRGPVHFFALNSAPGERHGIGVDSRQADWLRKQLASSTSAFNVVYLHRAPYSSDLNHGSEDMLQWPFATWGADVVMSGHAHTFERIERDGIVYFVNGLGGADRYRFKPVPVKGSAARFRRDWGAQKVTVTDDSMVFEFFATDGTLVDTRRVDAKP